MYYTLLLQECGYSLDKDHSIPNALSLRVCFEFIRESQENNDYLFLWTNSEPISLIAL